MTPPLGRCGSCGWSSRWKMKEKGRRDEGEGEGELTVKDRDRDGVIPS